MKSDGLARQMAIGLVLAVAGYITLWSCDSHLRLRKGPWEVKFTTLSNYPALVINQPALQISDVQIVFQGEDTPATNALLLFAHPTQPIPFGKTLFEDLTYLPGTVVFYLFGHEVELLPRTLVLNRHEKGWPSGKTLVLQATNKIPGLPDTNQIRKKRF